MSILNKFASLMCLTPNSVALREARNKFVGTYMVVNSDLCKVIGIEEDLLKVEFSNENTKLFDGSMVNNLFAWLPDSGVYLFSGTKVILKKIPHIQYRQSFSWEFYAGQGYPHELSAFQLFKSERLNNIFCHKDRMYYLDLVIGEQLKDGSWRCLNKVFQDEFDKV